MEEVWKEIPEFPEYEVSSFGNVKGQRDQILKPNKQKTGYLLIVLSKENKPTAKTIHSLVALAFIGPRPDNHDVDHIDRNRANNQLSNLRYVPRWMNLLNTGKTPNSGHTYIYTRIDKKFEVSIQRSNLRYKNTFSTLEDALEARDNHLRNISCVLPDDNSVP